MYLLGFNSPTNELHIKKEKSQELTTYHIRVTVVDIDCIRTVGSLIVEHSLNSSFDTLRNCWSPIYNFVNL